MSRFRIAAAQIAVIRGEIEANVTSHVMAIEAAARRGISFLVFPELSLTGYEPDLASELAVGPADTRLDDVFASARQHRMTVVFGAPLRNGTAKPYLGAIVIAGDGTISIYGKMHLGESERPFFAPGSVFKTIDIADHSVGLAICADASQDTHPQEYAERGADIYAAEVFLNAEWYTSDMPRLAGHAARHCLLVVAANHGQSVGTLTSVGRSAVWAPDGGLLAQAAGTETALVMATFDNGKWRGEIVEFE